ncbi:hypothetical protein B0H17DRAFT_403878 [Mycena rosella]|uniref:Uncharacterized protein n=1 Tax=Mycena rosella TaxID=1033263 RepID=A0AAD7CM04_MYCRO|nr:hypothetical protein B0H17DRAFT_403878 [Mycena rosella]
MDAAKERLSLKQWALGGSMLWVTTPAGTIVTTEIAASALKTRCLSMIVLKRIIDVTRNSFLYTERY